MIDNDHIPTQFFKADISINGRRHLMFATKQQLDILKKAKVWYIDGTFKLCRHPFTQLWTINAFVRKEDHAKQVPLLFVLMSGRKTKDYRAVLRELLNILPTIPAVKKITVDFEVAMWKAIQKVLPNTTLMGCVFHWTQAIWRKVCKTSLNFLI